MKKVLAVSVVLLFVIGSIPAFANCGSCSPCAKSGKGLFQSACDGIGSIGKASDAARCSSLKSVKGPAKTRGTALTPKNAKAAEVPAK